MSTRQSYSKWRAQVAAGFTYALFVFVGPALNGGGWLIWSLTAGSLLIFAYLYTDFFRAQPTRRALVDLGLMANLGFALFPFNLGATTYVVYTAALVPVALTPRRSVAVFLALAIGIGLEMAFLPSPNRLVAGGWAVVLIFIVGGGNLFIGDRERQNALLRRAHEDVEEMAKMAERERIARELHDILGHTLSVIALKSELASKLADRDPARSLEETGTSNASRAKRWRRCARLWRVTATAASRVSSGARSGPSARRASASTPT